MGNFKTIDQWINYWYNTSEGQGAAMNIMKADAPMLSTTSGMFNAIFGAQAFTQLNDLANTWNALPKKPRGQSGWRIKTARGFTLGTGGTADGGVVADTVKSTIVEVTAKPKLSQTAFEIGFVFDMQGDDDNYTYDEEKSEKGIDHIKDINSQLLVDVDTLAGNNFESIDRVCSNNSEVNDATIAITAGDADIYGLDRDSVTTFDAFVDHNSGVDRALTAALIRNAIKTIQTNSGKKPTMILTGYDQTENIQALFESQTRYLVDQRVSLGVNGVQTDAGKDVGLSVNGLYGIPIIEDDSVASDTGSRVYFLNTDTLWLGMTMPTQFAEGNDLSNILARGKFTRKGLYVTVGELICTMFSANGKIRDLL